MSVQCTETASERLIGMLMQTVQCKLCVEKTYVSTTLESFTTSDLVAFLKHSLEETTPLSVRPSVRPTAFNSATRTGRIFVKFHAQIFP
jgi:hypothetical protein